MIVDGFQASIANLQSKITLMPSFGLSFSSSVFLIALLVLIAIAASYYFYRHTIPPIPRGWRIFLITLRATALSLLFLFLFEPLLQLITSTTQRPVLALLVDDSKSMTIKDRSGERAAQVREVVLGPTLKVLVQKGEIRYYSFGTRAQYVENTDSLSFTQDGTDITAALRKVGEEKERLNIGAALLISDGNYNLGQNPLYEAEQLGIPVYTLGVGDSTEQRDVLITKLVTNDVVYNHTEVPIDVTVKSSGYKNEQVEVVLSDGSKELDRSRLMLQEGTREYSVNLKYVPDGEGIKKYSVRVSQLPGELAAANNQRTFLARVLKSKLRVLILAGTPSPDLSVIKQTLKEDKNLDVRSLTQKTPSSFYERQLANSLLDSTDCLVLIGFPSSIISESTLETIKASITKNETPVLFVSGKALDDRKLSLFGPLLPFTSSNSSTAEQLVFIEPVHKNHPALATNTDEGIESWKRLPPIFRTQTVYRVKAEATILAQSKINNITLSEPLIAIRNVNRQKSLAILGYGIWRWRLMAQGNPQTEKLLSALLSNSIRWLTTRDDHRPVKVTPMKPAFVQGEPIEFVGQVYDASANPVEDAHVSVVARQQDMVFETVLRPIGNGRYEGTLEGLGKGDYTFTSAALIEGQPVGEDRGRFSVGELNLEYQDTRMNVQLLRQLAERTGAECYLSSQANNLTMSLGTHSTFREREIRDRRELELWNWKYMLALVVLLFATEWFFRKRSGML